MNHGMKKVFGLVVLGLVVSGVALAQDVMPKEDFFKVCKWGTAKQMSRALASGVDVNAKDVNGVTALMRAAAGNASPEVVTMLLNSGAKVNARDREKRTALMWAANGKSSPETLKMLLSAGAHVNARSGNGDL